MLELLVELEVELLDLLVDTEVELFTGAVLETAALLMEFEMDETADAIALLVCTPVVTELLEEILELSLLLELLDNTSELVELLVVGVLLELCAGVDEAGADGDCVSPLVATELLVDTEGLLFFAGLKSDGEEPPAPPPQALRKNIVLSDSTAIFAIFIKLKFIVQTTPFQSGVKNKN